MKDYVIALDNGAAKEVKWDDEVQGDLLEYLETHKFVPVGDGVFFGVQHVGLIQEKQNEGQGKIIVAKPAPPKLDLNLR